MSGERTPLLSASAGTGLQEELTADQAIEKANEASNSSEKLLGQGKQKEALDEAYKAVAFATQAVGLAGMITSGGGDDDADTGEASKAAGVIGQANDALRRAEAAKGAAQPALTRWITWTYTGLFGRDGWLSAAPVMPGPRLPEDWKGDKSQLAFFAVTDAVNKTLMFFSTNSVSSSLAYAIDQAVAEPPGQQFDIRYIITQQGNTNFSLIRQFMTTGSTGTMSPIFWLVLIPLIATIVLMAINHFMTPSTKEHTKEAYDQANSWRECFRIYGWQVVEVLLANILVNVISLSSGTTREAVFSTPEMVNGMKVALFLCLDFVRNSLEKVVPLAQKAPCCQPREQSVVPA